MEVRRLLRDAPFLRQPPEAMAVDAVVFVAFVLVVAAIVMDFRNYHRQTRAVERTEVSLVETGTMAAFFAVYYSVIRMGLGRLRLEPPMSFPFVLAGLALLVVGAGFNVWGRLVLKSRWANQIKIYEDHELATSGPFSIVRHPLYASLIWTFVGGALIYSNVVALALTVLVFVPMMVHRGRKEDAVLRGHFGVEYAEWADRTGMLFPRFIRR